MTEQPFDPARFLLLVADSPEKLRSCDVYRLLDESGSNCIAMAVWIVARRSDLAEEVCGGLHDLVGAKAALLPCYRRLHDGLSNMVEGGRLDEGQIPDDFRWLKAALARLASLDPGEPQEESGCRVCGQDSSGGDGYDGLCPSCADQFLAEA